MKEKRGIELSFGWIFSVIVGGMVIVLAIYAVTRITSTERNYEDSSAAQILGTLLHPLETSIESASKPGTISFPVQTRISMGCSVSGNFGEQSIRIAQRSGIGKPWQDFGVPKKITNKYIFSSANLEGEKFYLLVKPFTFPFKIGDVIVMWNEPYCFLNPPTEIEDELSSLGINESALTITGSSNLCPKNSTMVCFSTGAVSQGKRCDVSVDTAAQRVFREGRGLYYEGALIYGAIFAESSIYECEVQRMMKRGSSLAELYLTKISIISSSSSGCGSALQPMLAIYSKSAKNATSRDISNLKQIAINLDRENNNLICQLWKERMA
ncbi:hypothetical protein J4461_00740 [Candidatus Pacearchaeota archaeon]|nr:hypothetical protein [Candidatus Pacearchaeota archaeon]